MMETNEHYCLVWEDAYGKLKVVDTCPPPEGSIKLYTHPANPYQSITDTKIEPTVVSYTHPVKELTDEEILEELLIPKSEWDSYKAHHCLKQIRAILRKASEK